jgi:hypothetical protein
MFVAAVVPATGCTTASFSPPRVDVRSAVATSSPTNCSQRGSGAAIVRDISGATELTDRFISAYRCAREEAVDGRQIFEVPSFLALIAGAIGPTYGLTNNGRIAALASAAVLGRANSYYAPKEKARFLDAALDAVVCIKTEAVGISFFDTTRAPPAAVVQFLAAPDAENAAVQQAIRQKIEQLAAQMRDLDRSRQAARSAEQSFAPGSSEREQAVRTQEQATRRIADAKTQSDDLQNKLDALAGVGVDVGAGADSGGSGQSKSLMFSQPLPDGQTVEVDVKQQYFEMVSASLLSVERVLAQRFRDAGSFDSAGIVAELQQVSAAKQEKDVPVKALTTTMTARALTDVERGSLIVLELQKLQPALQGCVVRAKLGG